MVSFLCSVLHCTLTLAPLGHASFLKYISQFNGINLKHITSYHVFPSKNMMFKSEYYLTVCYG
jgi:hypothetical protein